MQVHYFLKLLIVVFGNDYFITNKIVLQTNFFVKNCFMYLYNVTKALERCFHYKTKYIAHVHTSINDFVIVK